MKDQAKRVPRRRWRPVRWSVRVTVVAVLLIGGGLGWWLRSVRIQREAVEAVDRAGGYIRYDWAVKDGEEVFDNTGPPWPEWMVSRMGTDCFSSVTMVQANSGADAKRVLGTLQHFSRLQCLLLEASNISDQDLACVEGKRSLLKLDLSGTGVGDEGLAHLKALSRLKELSLGGTKVTDAGMAHLQGLTNLETLNLAETGVGDDGLALVKNSIHLKKLDLRSTRVTDAGLAHLTGLRDLRDLDLQGARISDTGLAHLEGLTRLTDLNLSETRVGDAGLAHLEGLAGLASLDLDSTEVTDSGLAHLKYLSNLRTLYIRSPRVTEAGLKALQEALPGLEINPVGMGMMCVRYPIDGVKSPMRLKDMSARQIRGTAMPAAPSSRIPVASSTSRPAVSVAHCDARVDSV